MASIKITELNERTEVGANDLIPIVDITANETKKITGANLLKNNYSTNEVKTNMKWIDGKPIYRKVINTGDLTDYSRYSDQNSITIPLNINNIENVANIKWIGTDTIQVYVDLSSYKWYGSDQNTICWYNLFISYDAGSFVAYIRARGSDRIGFVTSSYLIIEYTKTTD